MILCFASSKMSHVRIGSVIVLGFRQQDKCGEFIFDLPGFIFAFGACVTSQTHCSTLRTEW